MLYFVRLYLMMLPPKMEISFFLVTLAILLARPYNCILVGSFYFRKLCIGTIKEVRF